MVIQLLREAEGGQQHNKYWQMQVEKWGMV
jgi:hypothetical protein